MGIVISILHHFSRIEDCDILSFSGAKVHEISKLIADIPSLVDQASTILIHVGTNNIKKCMLLKDLLFEFCILIQQIRSLNLNARILISSILPRQKRF